MLGVFTSGEGCCFSLLVGSSRSGLIVRNSLVVARNSDCCFALLGSYSCFQMLFVGCCWEVTVVVGKNCSLDVLRLQATVAYGVVGFWKIFCLFLHPECKTNTNVFKPVRFEKNPYTLDEKSYNVYASSRVCKTL